MPLAFFSALILLPGLRDTQHDWPLGYTLRFLFKLHYPPFGAGHRFLSLGLFQQPAGLSKGRARCWMRQKGWRGDWGLGPGIMEVLLAPYQGDCSRERLDLQASSLRAQLGGRTCASAK